MWGASKTKFVPYKTKQKLHTITHSINNSWIIKENPWMSFWWASPDSKEGSPKLSTSKRNRSKLTDMSKI